MVPTVLVDLGLIRILPAVRVANVHLPPEQRIRVWRWREPDIDRRKSRLGKSFECVLGAHAIPTQQKIITDNILSKNEKGSCHLWDGTFPARS